jgi:energy-coupling factor transporter ATP-binding protein EcfA2
MKFRLIYLWIEEYKNVKRKELYFTKDYSVSFDEVAKEIVVSETDFGNSKRLGKNPLSRLDDFCAVIGENGSGKSNVFELINFLSVEGCFPDGYSVSSLENCAIVECLQGGNRSIKLISASKGYESKFINTEGLSFDYKILDFNDLKNNTIIYHPLSDIAAGFSVQNNRGLVKITSNPFQKLSSGKSNSALAKRFSDNVSSLREIDIFEEISNNKFSRLVLLYSEFQKKFLEFNGIHDPFTRMLKGTQVYLMYDKLYSLILEGRPSVLQYKLIYLCTSVFQVLQHTAEKDEAHINSIVISAEVLGDDSPFNEFSDEIKKRLGRRSYGSIVKAFEEHMNYISLQLESFEIEYNLVNGSFLYSPVGVDQDFGMFDYFCSNTMFDIGDGKHKFQGAAIPIKIDGLSSGQISLVHFVNEIKAAVEYSNDDGCLILLDEPEVSFHPEWQRRLVSILIRLFEKINVEPQVVIASHSPFVLSDMLRGKTLMLGAANKLDSCFASNVHDLLADSFFLKKTIGEAAIEQITLLLSFLNSPDVSSRLGRSFDDRRISSLFILEQIGDKFLKSELRKKLDKVILDSSDHNDLFSNVVNVGISNSEFRDRLQVMLADYPEDLNV